jgi:hypothetical protein
LLHHCISSITIMRQKNHQWTGRVQNSVITINFNIVSSIVSSSSNDGVKFKLTCWIWKFFLVNFLVKLGDL